MDAVTTESDIDLYLEHLRCPGCGGDLQAARTSSLEGSLACTPCGESYAISGGVPRMLLAEMRGLLGGSGRGAGDESRKAATAESFGYEWTQFSRLIGEYEQNFLDYQTPHGPDFFPGKRVLDAGCGSGRHAYYSGRYGAEVWAVDLGPAVEVARRNTRDSGAVRVVQADLCRLPFATESFDYIYSLGVLHHLPDPEAGFRNLLRHLRPGGEVRVYLYWRPQGQPLKRAMLAAVDLVRAVTTRLPYRAVHALAYPAAAAAFAGFVWPYRLLGRVPGLKGLAERIPMKQYAAYPFRVCVNDQLDRLSAPIENRYSRAEVEAWFARNGLEAVGTAPNFGWVTWGRKPLPAPADDR